MSILVYYSNSFVLSRLFSVKNHSFEHRTNSIKANLIKPSLLGSLCLLHKDNAIPAWYLLAVNSMSEQHMEYWRNLAKKPIYHLELDNAFGWFKLLPSLFLSYSFKAIQKTNLIICFIIVNALPLWFWDLDNFSVNKWKINLENSPVSLPSIPS